MKFHKDGEHVAIYKLKPAEAKSCPEVNLRVEEDDDEGDDVAGNFLRLPEGGLLESLIWPMKKADFLNDFMWQKRALAITNCPKTRYKEFVEENLFGLDVEDMIANTVTCLFVHLLCLHVNLTPLRSIHLRRPTRYSPGKENLCREGENKGLAKT